MRVSIVPRPAPVNSAAGGGETGPDGSTGPDGATGPGVASRPGVTLRIVRPLVAVLRALLRRVLVVGAVTAAGAAAWGAETAVASKPARSEPRTSGHPPSEPVAGDAVRAAVARALPLLARGAEGYMGAKKCFACHHQTIPLLAADAAGRRGFAIDDAYVGRVAAFVEKSLESGRSRYLEGRGQGGNTITAGYALWTLSLAGREPNDTTRLVADYLATAQSKEVHWRVTTHRPPSEGSHFAATFVALRGLQAYGSAKPSPEFAKRLEEVRSWLAATPAKETEDRVFRLWGLALVDADEGAMQAARDELLAKQRRDGGWGQLDRFLSAPRSAAQGSGGQGAAIQRFAVESDAYATGTALVALHAGGLATTDAAYRRGVAYLLKTQQADGSWRVKSRSKPIQTYFETGFPHGADQFISAAATGWATTALTMTLPVRVEP